MTAEDAISCIHGFVLAHTAVIFEYPDGGDPSWEKGPRSALVRIIDASPNRTREIVVLLREAAVTLFCRFDLTDEGAGRAARAITRHLTGQVRAA